MLMGLGINLTRLLLTHFQIVCVEVFFDVHGGTSTITNFLMNNKLLLFDPVILLGFLHLFLYSSHFLFFLEVLFIKVVLVVLDIKEFVIMRNIDLSLLFLLCQSLLILLLLHDHFHAYFTLDRAEDITSASYEAELAIIHNRLQLHFLLNFVDFFFHFLVFHQILF